MARCVPDVDVLAKLGEGTAGTVYKVLHQGKAYALKTFRGKNLNGGNMREIDILTRINHPNIVKAHLTYFTPSECKVCLMLELAEGDMYDFIDQMRKTPVATRRTVSPEQANIMFKLLCATAYLHANYIIHRDLKPENILMVGSEPKIADFGLATILPATEQSTAMVGTKVYMAPELLIRMPTFTAAVDIWSLGCTFYHLITGRELVDSETGDIDECVQQIIDRIEDFPDYMKGDGGRRWVYNDPRDGPDYFQNIPSRWKGMLKYMLTVDPEQRPTAEDLINTYFGKRAADPSEVCNLSTRIENLPFSIALYEFYEKVRSDYLRGFYEEQFDHEDEDEYYSFFLGVDIADRFFTVDRTVDPKDIPDYILECFRIAYCIYGAEVAGNMDIRCRIVNSLDFRLFRPTIDTYFPDIPRDQLAYSIIKNPTPDEIGRR